MNLRKALARKTKGASGAAKNYFGWVPASRNRHDERFCDRVTANTGRTAAKLKDVFQR